MSIRSVVKILWRKRWLLVAVPLTVMAIVFAVRFLGDWKYASTAQIATGITTGHKLVDKDNRPGPDEMQMEFNNLIEVIKSPMILNQVSYRLLQHDIPASSYSFRRPSESKIAGELGINMLAYEEMFRHILDTKLDNRGSLDPGLEDERLLQRVIDVYGYGAESLLDRLSIRRLNNSDYVELHTYSENPELSAFIVNTFCSEITSYYKSLQQNQADVSLELLAEEVVRKKESLDERQAQLQEFRSSNEIVNADVEGISNISQIKSYEDQISAEEQNQRGLELNLASLNIRIQDGEGGSASRLNDEAVAIRRKITSFNEQYVTGGQSDQQLLDSITALRARLDQTLKRIEQAPKYTPAEIRNLKERREQVMIDLQVSREHQASLTRKLNALRFNMGDFATREAKRKLIEEQTELARTEYLNAQQRYAQAQQQIDAQKLAIEQVVIGEPARKPEIRGAVILIGSSGAATFLLLALIVLVREFADPRIKTPQRLRSMVRVSDIGVVPRLSREVKNPSWNFFLDAQSPELSRLNDDLRKIRYALDQSGAQVFLVTSTQKGQGKTFLVMALAYALSLARKRTLIIDTNLRHNSLTRSLTARVNLRQSIDLYNSNVRQLPAGAQMETQDKAEANLITRTHNELVDVIGNKISHLSPSEVIPADDFTKLLNWLKKRYDYIFLEGASLNESSDSRELVAFVEKVIPVFAADTVLSDEDKDALQFLRSLNGKLGITILNRTVQPESSMAAATL